MEPTLTQLFERARQGDEDALTQLIVELSDRFNRYAYRLLGHREDAEDVAQQAAVDLVNWMSSWRELERRRQNEYQFSQEENIKAFVFTLVIRAARAARRRRTRLGPSLDPTDARLTDLLDPFTGSDTVDRADDIRCVLQALDTLEAADREVIEQSCLVGLNSSQIETLTGTSRNTIRSRLMAARRRLREAVALLCPQLAVRLFEDGDWG